MLTAAYLIIARAARALVASARSAGLRVFFIDSFIDNDYQTLAAVTKPIGYQADGFVVDALCAAVRQQQRRMPGAVIVAASGFEYHPEHLDSLSALAPVISNSAETIRRLKEPFYLSALLSKHAIKHPLPRLVRPAASGPYLIKKTAGSGGCHIQWAGAKGSLTCGEYYQQFIAGRVMSAVFLAAAGRAKLVGFNQQLPTGQFSAQPFLYQGAIRLSPSDVTSYQAEVNRIIQVISKETDLTGLCGLDFIIDEHDDVHVLEVNPRPPATFELHEHSGSLFSAHIKCFTEHRIDYEPQTSPINNAATAIVYAGHAVTVAADVNWCDWVRDRPPAGQKLAQYAPVCSVYAEASGVAATQALLSTRSGHIEAMLALKSAA